MPVSATTLSTPSTAEALSGNTASVFVCSRPSPPLPPDLWQARFRLPVKAPGRRRAAPVVLSRAPWTNAPYYMNKRISGLHYTLGSPPNTNVANASHRPFRWLTSHDCFTRTNSLQSNYEFNRFGTCMCKLFGITITLFRNDLRPSYSIPANKRIKLLHPQQCKAPLARDSMRQAPDSDFQNDSE